MSRALLREIVRTIFRTKSRFLSLIIIIALGAGIFVGAKAAVPDMKETAKTYFSENNLMDLRVRSTLGLTDDDISAISDVENVSYVMPSKFTDALVFVNGSPEIDIDGSQISTRAYGMSMSQLENYFNYVYKSAGTDDGSFMNRPQLIEGSYPTSDNECLVDASTLSTPDSFKIGAKISLEGDSGASVSDLNVTEFTVVGIIRSPYYLSYERGNSLVGSGKIGTFIIIPDTAFSTDYYTEAYIKVASSENYDPFSQEYTDMLKPVADKISEISAGRINVRVADLAASLPGKITAATAEYKTAKDNFDKKIREAKEQIAKYQHYVDDPDGAYKEAVEEFAGKYGLAADEYSGNESNYYSSVEQYSRLLAEYNTKNNELEEKRTELNTAKTALDTADRAISTSQSTVDNATTTVTTMKQLIASTETVLKQLKDYQNSSMDSDQVNSILSVIKNAYPEIYNAIKSQSAQGIASEANTLLQTQLTEYKVQLAVAEEALTTANKELANAQAKVDLAQVAYDEKEELWNTKKAELKSAADALQSYYDQLQIGKSNLTLAQVELMISENSGENSLDSLKMVIANAQTYLDKATTEYVNQSTQGEKQLLAAENSIKSAQKLLDNLPSASWTVCDRYDTPGYSSYIDAVNTVSVLSNVFPVFFFIVAALVCLVTMTRMVEEERTQMGTLKAIGYSSSAIISKYMLYAFFSSFIGSAIGVTAGIYGMPIAIFKAYSVMFSMPELIITFPVVYIILGMGISLLVTMGSAWVCCMREISSRTALLMRPKPPKAGRRVLLEKIGFIWKHLNFTSKVTARNLARNKTRFFMTVVGIAGCMSLILGSIGFFTSLKSVMSRQYGENGVDNYDYQLVFDSPQTRSNSELLNALASDDRVGSLMLTSVQSVSGSSDESDKIMDVYLFVPEDSNYLDGYKNLRNRKTGESLKLDDSGAIVTEAFAKDANVSVGDSVWVENDSGERKYITVAGITENYTFQYIYMSPNYYKSVFSSAPSFSYAIGSFGDSVRNSADIATAKAQFNSDLMKYDSINAVAFQSDTINSFEKVINIVGIIIMIFIVAAGVLAFVVLYNLTNINIAERHRELATIKVLGFTDMEVSNYIYRENVILTILGIVIGIFGGIGLHKIMIEYVKVDAIMFVQNIIWYDYLIAVGITVLFAVLVNFIMHGKMKKISMVESLKSVE